MPIDVRPITAPLGAEVSGVDMADVDGEALEQRDATADFHPETRHVERVTTVGDAPF